MDKNNTSGKNNAPQQNDTMFEEQQSVNPFSVYLDASKGKGPAYFQCYCEQTKALFMDIKHLFTH